MDHEESTTITPQPSSSTDAAGAPEGALFQLTEAKCSQKEFKIDLVRDGTAPLKVATERSVERSDEQPVFNDPSPRQPSSVEATQASKSTSIRSNKTISQREYKIDCDLIRAGKVLGDAVDRAEVKLNAAAAGEVVQSVLDLRKVNMKLKSVLKSGELAGFEWVTEARSEFVKRCPSNAQVHKIDQKCSSKEICLVDEKMTCGAFCAVICTPLMSDKSGSLFGFVKPLKFSEDLRHQQNDYFFFHGKPNSGTIRPQNDGAVFTAGLSLSKGDELIIRHLKLRAAEKGKKDKTLCVRYASLVKASCSKANYCRFVDYLESLKSALMNGELRNDALACLEQDKTATLAVWDAIASLSQPMITDSILTVLEGLLALCYSGTTIRRRGACGSVHMMLTSKISSFEHCFLNELFNQSKNNVRREKFISMLLQAWKFFPSQSRRFIFFMLKEFSESHYDEASVLLPTKTMLSLLQLSLHGGDTISCYAWRDLPMYLLSSEFLSCNEILLQRVEDDRPNLFKVLSEGGSYETFDRYMEVYVGLLREDCFASMRNGLRALGAGALNEHQMRVFLCSSVVAMSPPNLRSKMEGTILEFLVPCNSNAVSRPPLFGSLLLLAPQGHLKSKHLIWATVAGADASHVKGNLRLFTELCSDLNADSEASLVGNLLQASGHIMIAESPTFYRAYAPAIEVLQGMSEASVPSFELIVKGNESNNLVSGGFACDGASLDASIVFDCGEEHNLKSIVLKQFLSMLEEEYGFSGRRSNCFWTTSLDSSQAEAIHSALTRKISIIQGPPGTGKTFVGVKIVQLLSSIIVEGQDEAKDEVGGPILILTFKNRALDDFLEACFNVWPKGVARIGGASSPGSCLEQRHIRELMRSEGRRSSETESARKHADFLRDEVQEKAKALKRARQFSSATFLGPQTRRQLRSLLLNQIGTLSPEEKCSIDAGLEETPVNLPNNWRQILKLWLPDRKFCNTMAKTGSYNTASRSSHALPTKAAESWEELSIKANERNQFRSIQETAVRFDDDRSGDDGCDDFRNVYNLLEETDDVEEQMLLNEDDIWSLDKASKVKLMSVMAKSDFARAEQDYDLAMDAYLLTLEHARVLELADQTKLLSRMEIVGMTISGAAIYRDTIEELKPRYVLVEEAAEVLEPQLMAGLGPWVQRLILIGDHQQLRPTVENHNLARDYNFNISMMERLVKNKVSHVTLTKQARMRPEFAKLLNDEYPKLESSHRVLSRSELPPPCGMGTAMYWWDIASDETLDSIAQSHINKREIRAVAALFSHMTRGGVHAARITILASYSAQVELIKKNIAALMDNSGNGWPIDRIHGVASRNQLGMFIKKDSSCKSRENSWHQSISIADTLLKVGDVQNAIASLEVALKIESCSENVNCMYQRAIKLRKLIAAVSDADLIDSLKALATFSTKCQNVGDIACAAASCIALERIVNKAESSSVRQVLSEGKSRLLRAMAISAERQLHELRSQNSATISSIDRYQGSENDVLIISLVRSNSSGSIGFLKEPARRIVAQSRAKFGMYFVGNNKTFQAASEKWKSFILSMSARSCLSPKIPLCCPRHATMCAPCVEADEDGVNHIMEGICNEICGCVMSCGEHFCDKKCHGPAGDNGDLHVICYRKVQDKCHFGHSIERVCYQRSVDVTCKACEKLEAARRKKEEEERKAREKDAMNRVQKEIEEVEARECPNYRRSLDAQCADALEYTTVCDRTEKYIQLEHGYPIVVTRVEKLWNQSLELKFLKAKKRLYSGAAEPNILQLFHGTGAGDVESICEDGFKLPARSSKNMFGCGLYFATDSSKSAQKIYTKGSNCLLLCEVLMGRSCRIGGLNENHPLHEYYVRKAVPPFLDITAEIMEKKCFDSVYAQRDSREKGGVKYDEMVVYDEAQAIPRYIVHFSSYEGVSAAKRAIAEQQMLNVGQVQLRKIKIPANTALHDPENIDEYHYRFVESQFHRMFRREANKCIVCVEVVYNQQLLGAFEAKQRKYKDEKINSEVTLGFHGTSAKSGKAICTTGFTLTKVGSATDRGWYGAGIYFSFNTHTAVGYDKGCLLLCELLRGKTYKLTASQRRDGEGCKEGFNSHTVEDGNEIVMFEMDAINPKYIVHYV